MPKLSSRSFPKLSRHKSGQAKIRFQGRDIYLGVHGTAEAESAYYRARSEYLLTGQLPDDLQVPKRQRSVEQAKVASDDAVATVDDLAAAFMRYAEGHYVKNGKTTDEIHCYRSALRFLQQAYGQAPVNSFGPKALQAVRAAMVSHQRKDGSHYTRGFVNKSVSRIRHVFSWGVSQELVKPEVLVALRTVAGLQAGRTPARDNPKRRPVPQEHLDTVKAAVKERTADILELLVLTGARPGEILSLTPAMLDRAGEVWKAEIKGHKTEHHGGSRVLLFGPSAQAILSKYLDKTSSKRRLFPIRRDTLSSVVKAACLRRGIKPFVPHALRHTALTRVRAKAGADVAQVLAGHTRLTMTELYAQPDVSSAVKYAATLG